MSRIMGKSDVIGRCMYNLIWEIPGSKDWTPEMHESIREELEKVYEEGRKYGKEHPDMF